MRRFIFILLISLPSLLCAQSDEPALRARLIGQPLYLRGMWDEDVLSFDRTGQILESSTTGSFTLAGIEIDSLHLTSTALVLVGQRVGLEFKNDKAKRVRLRVAEEFGSGSRKQAMHIEISVGPIADLSATLTKIFTGTSRIFYEMLQSAGRPTSCSTTRQH